MKLLTELFKIDMYYAAMVFVFELYFAIVIFNSELHHTIIICKASFGMRSHLFYYGRHSSKILPLGRPVVMKCKIN